MEQNSKWKPMIDFKDLEKVAEYKNGDLNWLEGRDINAVYVIENT